MIREGHYGSKEIKDLLGRLNESWSELVSKSADKGSRLQQAQQQQQFNRAMEDVKVGLASNSRTESLTIEENTVRIQAATRFEPMPLR